jgi:hypothetical protein
MAGDRRRLALGLRACTMSDAREEAVLHREMGCSRADLLAWLPGAVRGAAFDVEGDLIRVAYADGEVRIRIGQAAERKLGELALPVLQVSIGFAGIDAHAREEFLEYFDLFTRRGGG